jgi:hypothetical protein
LPGDRGKAFGKTGKGSLNSAEEKGFADLVHSAIIWVENKGVEER